jgi:hypothetical protein
MSNALFAAFAIALPWGVSALWIGRIASSRNKGDWAIALGYGYFIGLFVTVALLNFWDLVGLGLHVQLTAAVWLVAAGAWALSLRFRGSLSTMSWRPRVRSLQGWREWVWLALFVLVAGRVLVLGLDAFWRPLTPWDAWLVWLYRAAVWAEFGTLVPFVEPGAWLSREVPGAFMLDAHHYPKTVSLIPTWIALTLGEWNESLLLLPWVGALVALLLGLYGQVRRFGGEPWEAMLVIYLVSSLPMVATHTALAGYADLWVAAALALAAAALWSWRRHGSPVSLVLALPLLVALPTLKVEGWVWLLPLALGLILAQLRLVTVGGLIAVVGGLALVWLLAGGFSVSLPGLGEVVLSSAELTVPGLLSVGVGYRPEAWSALRHALFVGGNWHLFWFVFVPVGLLGLYRSVVAPDLRAPMYTVLLSAFLLVFLFVFTEASQWVVSFTIVNRLLLHFVPMAVFVVWLVIATWWSAANAAGSSTPRRPLR